MSTLVQDHLQPHAATQRGIRAPDTFRETIFISSCSAEVLIVSDPRLDARELPMTYARMYCPSLNTTFLPDLIKWTASAPGEDTPLDSVQDVEIAFEVLLER